MKSPSITSSLLQRDQRLFAAAFWILAAAGLIQSGLIRMHEGMTANWYSLSFYFVIPAILWSFSLPAIRRLHDLLTLRLNFFQSVLGHALISIPFTMALKFAALAIDFHLQRILGTMMGTFSHFIRDIQFLYLTSIIENIALYWLVALVLYLLPGAKGAVARRKEGPGVAVFVVKERDRETEIPLQDIQFIEASGNYLKIHLHQSTHCVRGTITSLEKQLPKAEFFRVHRSFIVNKASVCELSPLTSGRYIVKVNGGKLIPTGRQFLPIVRHLLSILPR